MNRPHGGTGRQDVVVDAADARVQHLLGANGDGRGEDDDEAGKRDARGYGDVGGPAAQVPSRARSVKRSATEPSARRHVPVKRSSTTSTWRNCSVRSATAVNALRPTGVVLQPPPLTT